MDILKRLFALNAAANAVDRLIVIAFWSVVGLLLWQFNDNMFIPKPLAVLDSFEAVREHGALLEFGTSLWTMFWAIVWTLLISHTLAYASAFKMFRPLASFITGWRYFGFVGIQLPLTLLVPDGATLKIVMLTYGMTVFYLRTLLDIVQNIPEEQFDHASTLGMKRLRILYEVVVRGTLADALTAFRGTAAMAWMMLTTVEGIVRSQGGIGAVLINMDRHADMGQAFAILILIFIIGLLQDAGIAFAINHIICPYARIGKGNS